jgi:hypothetical protein
MSDGCINCIAAIQQAQSADQQTRKAAEALVMETAKAVALYRDEYGKLCYVLYEISNGYPVSGVISPQYLNAQSR